MDLFEKCYGLTRADEPKAMDMCPYFPPIEAVQGNTVSVVYSDEELDTILGSFEKCGKPLGIL